MALPAHYRSPLLWPEIVEASFAVSFCQDHTFASATVQIPELSRFASTTSSWRLGIVPVAASGGDGAPCYVPHVWPPSSKLTLSVNECAVDSVPHSFYNPRAARTYSVVDITELAKASKTKDCMQISIEVAPNTEYNSVFLVTQCRRRDLNALVEEVKRRCAEEPTRSTEGAVHSGDVRKRGREETFDFPSSSDDDDEGVARKGDNAPRTSTRSKEAAEALAVGSVDVSLRCPLSFHRIRLPAKGRDCTHDACFDLSTYLINSHSVHAWNCPVCGGAVYFKDLVICAWFQSILRSLDGVTIDECDRVRVFPDKSWERSTHASSNSSGTDHTSEVAVRKKSSPHIAHTSMVGQPTGCAPPSRTVVPAAVPPSLVSHSSVSRGQPPTQNAQGEDDDDCIIIE